MGFSAEGNLFVFLYHLTNIRMQEFDYELEVEGEIPNDLKGTLFRNGPGLLEVYGTPLVHPIDGDGMVQKLSCI